MVREWDILVCRAEMMGNINQAFVLFLYYDFVVPFREYIMSNGIMHYGRSRSK